MPGVALGETLAQMRARETEMLTPLQKVTAGPDDQYNADLDSTGRVLVFTEKSGLVASLRLLDLVSGETMPLLPLNADAEEAIFGPGGRIAFTYYKLNARGDICYVTPPAAPFRNRAERPVSEGEIRCIKRTAESGGGSSHQRSNPFWRSARQIGYLERDFDGQKARVVVENVRGGERSILAEGHIWSPSMRPAGRFLAYLETFNGGRRIVVKDIESGSVQVARFALPGFSAFPTISPDEKFLYFSHFLNDTNGDQLIDGADNGVVFRVAIEKIFAGSQNEVLPEQLTSVETSCGFPRVTKARLLMTCAFEGSLDIYGTDVTGIVPAHWEEARIANAIDTSRSYQDRILLLNTLLYRFYEGKDGSRIEERLFSDHVLADDVSAARFYLSRVRSGEKDDRAQVFSLLDIYLAAREIKKAQPEGQISAEFRRQMNDFDKRARGIKSGRNVLVRAHLRHFLGDHKGARDLLAQANWSGRVHPLERYLHFDLARSLYRGQKGSAYKALSEAYRHLVSAAELDEQSRLFYTFSFLQDTEKALVAPKERLQAVKGFMKPGLVAQVESLLKAEIAILGMVLAPDENLKTEAFKELDKLLSSTRDDYFLRRALYVRAIANFNRPLEIRYLGVIARNWLRYTSKGDTEFSYAREVFADNSLTQAYSHLGKGERLLADNYFFESLTLTDDLESHYGFITARIAEGRRAELEGEYKNLEKRKFITDNMKFVEAALELFDDAASGGAETRTLGSLNKAIDLLESMTQGDHSDIRHLLLGYAYMEKLMRSAKGYDFDASLLQKAHRELMLAYDLGWDNRRVRASALMNLGILHQRIRNHGQAARFFLHRKSLGFETDEERARFEYLYARSLSHNFQPDLAAEELGAVQALYRTVPHEERRAFNLAIAGQFQEAAKLYDKLISERKISGTENLAKAYLVHGYSKLKLNRREEARKSLLKAIIEARSLKIEKRAQERGIDFEPVRIELIAYGLLAQTGTLDERLTALHERSARLEKARPVVGNWSEARIQVRMQIAELESAKGREERAAQQLKEALELATEYGDSEQYIGKLTFRAASNFMAHAVLHPKAYSKDDLSKAQGFVKKCRDAYEAQKIMEPVLDMQNLKLQILLWGMSRKIEGAKDAAVDSILATDRAARLKDLRPDLFSEAALLAKTVR